ncbi:MAG: MBL fold metallo-hydrolase [Myxococcota bacterium]|nr:MBL fold metallo-hydrolase [Myxococcota bacterium]
MLLYITLIASALAGILNVEILDVGQGDSILIRSPAGKTVLIDGGTGRKNNIVDYLRARQIEELNMMVATHAHADHIGGLDEVLAAIPVKLFLDSGLPHTTQSYKKVMNLVENKNIKYMTAKAGRIFRLDDGIELKILHPQDALLRSTRSDLNSNSVVIRLTHKNNCFLFTGDAEEPTEHLLVQKGLEPCKVLKVSHHGSNHSSTPSFLKAVQPEIALISLGAGNRYGHPGTESMKRLKRTGAAIYRTDLLGTIQLQSDGNQITVTSDRNDAKPIQSKKVSIPISKSEMTEPPIKKDTSSQQNGFNINTATQSQLESISGIGPKKAQAILQFLESNGPIQSHSELQKVKGIGAKTAAKIAAQSYIE